MAHIPLAWSQLVNEKLRLLAAVAGIAFAVILMLMQLGFRDALFTSITQVHRHLRGDLVLVSSQYVYLVSTKVFTQRRLYQALAFEEVESVAPLYVGVANWKNPETYVERPIFVIGFDPNARAFEVPGLIENLGRIQIPDVVLFDLASRPEFGPIAEQFRKTGTLVTEVNGRKIEVGGLVTLGASFAADGNLITSDLNFLRLMTMRQQGLIDMGLITLKSGADPERVRAQLEAALPKDIKVMTREGFVDREKNFWASNAPIGFVFNLGVVMGLIVGTVIVYQILYTDVSDHLAEYATLKALGYTNRYLFSVVIQESLILSILGFLPGYAIAQTMYIITQRTTHLPIHMTLERVLMVFILTVVMCTGSGAVAMRKLQSADPAEIF
jgi:putative ABC transport system permease protein